MKNSATSLSSTLSRLLLAAGVVLVGVAAQAAGGYSVNQSDESLVKPGMSTAEVQSTLGTPAENVRFANEPGPTFTYRVNGVQNTLFDVDFGADGRVASVSERIIQTR